jgi:hypothetical protein
MKRISPKENSSGTGWATRIIACLPLLLLFGGAAYGAGNLWQNGWNDRRFVVLPSASLTESAHLDPAAVAEFSALSDFVAGKSLLRFDLLSATRDRYAQCAWVKEVCRVERVFPREITVEFIPRRPRAQAQIGGKFYLFDDEKILLTASGVAAPRENLPRLTGEFIPPPVAGAEWHDDGITAALNALAAIENSPLGSRLSVAEISLKRTPFLDKLRREQQSRPRLEITTRDNIHILWGADARGLPDEATAEDKVAMLGDLLKRPPQNRRKISLDVRTAIAGYKLRQAPAVAGE